jgi:hypothetical protein
MILVRIHPSEDKFLIELSHKIDYVVEKKFGRTKSLNRRTAYLFTHLIIAAAILLIKEMLMRFRK